MTPDIERLRRFGLIVALILISYAAAGVELESGAKVSVLGLPFVILRPELLPLGLMLASAYALVRYYYYGFMLSYSPQRRRKNLLHRLHGHGGHGTYTGSVFFGPTAYSTTPLHHDMSVVEAQLQETIATFPKIWNIRPIGKIEGHQFVNEDGEDRTAYGAEITIPFWCRLAALIQDIDYSAPIWLNLAALIASATTL